MQQVETPDVGTFRLGVRGRLVVASFLMLFCELALIRWVSAYQVHVAYFTNFVLLASFLGIGVGFLRAGKPRDLSRWAPVILAAVLAGVSVLRVVKATDSDSLRTAFELPAPPIFVMLPLLFLGSVLAMAAVAEGAARLFARFEPLEAYRLDIAGSLGGIVVFSLMSFLQLGPAAWGIVIATGFIALTSREDRRRLAASVGVGAVLVVGSLISPLDSWSPYYRVTVRDADESGRIGIVVNSLPHQSMLPLAELEQRLYSMPYRHLPRAPRDVLIVGAGNGNDVALALSRGVRRIDAVEIDPVIQEAGRDRHPAQPYRDPRVARTSTTGARSWSEPTGPTTSSCSPCRIRSRWSAAKARCGSRAICSHARRWRPCGTTCDRVVPSPCTTTTATTCSGATPRRCRRSSGTTRASTTSTPGRDRAARRC